MSKIKDEWLKNPNCLFFGSAIILVLLDQFTKWWIINNISVHSAIQLIPNFLQISHITNKGAAFGILPSFTTALSWFSIIVIGGILYYHKTLTKKISTAVLGGLLLGGTLGNLIDRLTFGFVIDFIDFSFWPAFNIADSAITISVIFFIIVCWKE